MTPTAIQKPGYLHCDEDSASLRSIYTVQARIRSAYFGRQSPQSPLGLNVEVDHNGATHQLTIVPSFMDDYKVNRPEELAGRLVLAAFPTGSRRMVGLFTLPSLEERAA